MKPEEMAGLTRGIATAVKEMLAPLAARLKAIEDRPAPQNGVDGREGKDGLDGKSVDMAEVRALVQSAVSELPPPAAGKDGKDGKDADPTEVQRMVAEAVAAIPRPQDGKDGIDGKSVTIADVESHLEAQFSKWALAFEIRAGELMQRTIDRLPKPRDGIDGQKGADGRDGFGFEDMTVDFDGERTAVVRFARGELVKEFPIRFPVVLDRGVHKADTEYQQGDGVTLQGSWWIAQKDNPPGKPGDPESGWRLAVKAGRPGKDGIGTKGDPGPPGKDGRNYDGTRAV